MVKFYLSCRGGANKAIKLMVNEPLTSVKNVSSSLACTSLSSPLHLENKKEQRARLMQVFVHTHTHTHTSNTNRSQGLGILYIEFVYKLISPNFMIELRYIFQTAVKHRFPATRCLVSGQPDNRYRSISLTDTEFKESHGCHRQTLSLL